MVGALAGVVSHGAGDAVIHFWEAVVSVLLLATAGALIVGVLHGLRRFYGEVRSLRLTFWGAELIAGAAALAVVSIRLAGLSVPWWLILALAAWPLFALYREANAFVRFKRAPRAQLPFPAAPGHPHAPPSSPEAGPPASSAHPRKPRAGEWTAATRSATRDLQALLAEMDSFVGNDAVKEQVHDLIALVQVDRRRRAQGKVADPMTLHLRFDGPPGTGKTTFARLIGEIYAAIGVLPGGGFVEASRADLVGEYQGATALKTNAVFDRAKGGVLFIDEAYSLISGPGDTFGNEALTELLRRMENDRASVAVVIAGYPDKLAKFLDANEGLRSRFSQEIRFDEYSPAELLEIARRMIAKQGYTLEPDAEELLAELIERAHAARDKRSWGNARECRRIVEAMRTAHARRLAQAKRSEPLDTFTRADVVAAAKRYIA